MSGSERAARLRMIMDGIHVGVFYIQEAVDRHCTIKDARLLSSVALMLRPLRALSRSLKHEANEIGGSSDCDMELALRIGSVLESIRLPIDYALEGMMHMDMDVSGPKKDLVDAHLSLEAAKQKMADIGRTCGRDPGGRREDDGQI